MFDPLLLALAPLVLPLPQESVGPNPLDPLGEGALPWPSLHFSVADEDSPTGVRLDCPRDVFTGPDGPLPFDLEALSAADGVSPISPMLVNFGVDLDPSFLSGAGEQAETVAPGAPIALMHAETGALVPVLTEMDATNRDREELRGRHALVIRPLAPMEMGARYAVLLRDALRSDTGEELPTAPAFVSLRDGTPTDDAAVEAMRPRFEQLFDVAEEAGFPRDELLLAWDLQVASEAWLLGPVTSIRDQVLAAAEAGEIGYEIDSVEVDPNDNVGWLVEGRFTPPSFLDERNELRREGHGVRRTDALQEYPFTVLVPPAAKTRGDLPLVLFGHGLFGTGRHMLSGGMGRRYVQPLAAEAEAVMIATDWIGLSGGDLQLILREVVPDLGRIRLVTDRLAQAHGNNLALVELALGALQADPVLERASGTRLIDPERVYYYGASLGGIQGATQVALSPRITRAVLGVPGAGWSHMMQRSTQFKPIEAAVDRRWPDPQTQTLFTAVLQSWFDLTDPGVVGALLRGDETKTVVLQEAVGDCQVPNISTDLLARTLGAVQLGTAARPVFGLAASPGPVRGVALTQFLLPDLLEAFTPPDANLIPHKDNGVHDKAILSVEAFAQLAHLVATGEAVHPCDGTCDPD